MPSLPAFLCRAASRDTALRDERHGHALVALLGHDVEHDALGAATEHGDGPEVRGSGGGGCESASAVMTITAHADEDDDGEIGVRRQGE